MENDTILTINDAAEVLKVSAQKVYALVQAEIIPAIRIGKCRRILRSDLTSYVRGLRAAESPQPVA